jgi:hypothetical protein
MAKFGELPMEISIFGEAEAGRCRVGSHCRNGLAIRPASQDKPLKNQTDLESNPAISSKAA